MRVVLVEPEYEINLGYVCRVMDNFGLDDLILVNPKFSIGFRAVQFSKNSSLLKNLKIVRNLEEALENSSFIVGTTGVKAGNLQFPGPVSLQKVKPRKNMTILLGREGSGLSKDELKLCDLVVRIPTNPKHPTLNISHALAILLYHFLSQPEKIEPPSRKEISHLLSSLIFLGRKVGIRNVNKLKNSFKLALATSFDREKARILLALFSRLSERLKKNNE